MGDTELPPATSAGPVFSTYGNVCTVTRLESLQYTSGTLRKYCEKVGICEDSKSKIVLTLLPFSRKGCEQMELRSPDQVRDLIKHDFSQLLKGVEMQNCVFMVPSTLVLVRSTVKLTSDGCFRDWSQHVSLQTLFHEVFPDADVFAYVPAESTNDSGDLVTDLTASFQTLLHEVLPPGRQHHVVVPDFFSTHAVAAVPSALSPKDSALVYVQNNDHSSNLSDTPQTLRPYTVLGESAEIQVTNRQWPEGVIWMAFSSDGEMLSAKACTAYKSNGSLRITDSNTVTIVGVFPPGCNATNCLLHVNDDGNTPPYGYVTSQIIVQTCPWKEAFGKEDSALAASISSLVDKVQRTLDFIEQTFPQPDNEVLTQEKTASMPTQRIYDSLTNHLVTQLRTHVHARTASMMTGDAGSIGDAGSVVLTT